MSQHTQNMAFLSWLCCRRLLLSPLFMLYIVYYVHKEEVVSLNENTGLDDQAIITSLGFHKNVPKESIINTTVNHHSK